MLILKKFSAGWCGPCRALGPIVEEVCEELKDVVVLDRIDVDLDIFNARAYNIRSVPTLVLETESGEKLWTHIGMIGKNELLVIIKQYSN